MNYAKFDHNDEYNINTDCYTWFVKTDEITQYPVVDLRLTPLYLDEVNVSGIDYVRFRQIP